MITAIIAIVAFIAIVIAAICLVRIELTEEYDYCDCAASEPAPLDHPHIQPWKPFGESQ